MYIITDQVCKWRQRKHKKNIVSILSKFLVMTPLVILTSTGIAMSAPTGGVITGGSGSITQVESATNINQASQRLDINWQTFSTQVHESVNFYQPNSQSLAINRVIGGVPSELRGALNANGRVFILNNAGITFYGTSQINVGALLATTAMDITEDGSRLSFSGNGYGTVLNQGVINVSDGGFAVLAAPHVANTGVIQANLGHIQLASTNAITMDFRGDGLIDFTVPKGVLDGVVSAGDKLGVDNTGVLKAGSGTINITANLASDVIQSVVNLDGVVDASAFGPGTNGGTVLVTSVGDTNIGGEVHADGGLNGNGGSIYTWADHTNRFESGATMTARGGEVSGNGGTVEVSGHDVIFRGTANASAPNGKAGTLIIDPWDLTIADGAGTDGSATVYEQNIEATSQGGTSVNLVADHSITMNDLADDELKGGNGSISMTVNGSPSFGGGPIIFVDKNDTITTTGGSITMSAADGAEGVGAIDIGNLKTTRNYANITLYAESGGIKTGNLTTGGEGLGVPHPGVISLTTTNGGDITAGDISIIAEGYSHANARLNIDAAGSINVGSVLVKADASSSEGSAYARAGADMKAGAGGITVTGGIEVDAKASGYYGDTTEADAHATLTAVGGVTVNNGIIVQANAEMSNGSNATANATLAVTADYGNINITGDILVKADSTVGSYGYYGTANANAKATLTAGHEINIDGNINVEAKAVNNGTEAYEANADAYLEIIAGNAAHDNLKINGNITVVADATNYGTDTASANANAYLWSSLHDININGDITVRAKAVHNGSDDDASPTASLYANAGHDLNVTGNILVESTATRNNGRSGDDASADGSLELIADHDMNIKGDVKVIVDAMVNQGSDANAYAYMSAWARHDLKITGDILVKADATMGPGGTDSADAYAYAHISAGHNVTLLTDPITVAANAVSNSSGGASANAYLDIAAGTCEYNGECTPSGDLYITGDVAAIATATVTNPSSSDGYFYTHSSEYASVRLSAPDSITNLYGTAPPKAYAPNPADPAHALAQSSVAGYFSDWFGSYSDGAEGYAQLSIEADSVTIEPKSTPPAGHVEEERLHEVVSSLESREVEHVEPQGLGNEPLRITAEGLALWATGAGVTSPSQGFIVTQEAQNEIEKGVDPTKVLPATAAGGGIGLASGVDAYSVGGADYCDHVVSGYCLPSSGGKKK